MRSTKKAGAAPIGESNSARIGLYNAVSLVSSSGACSAVKALKGHRILAAKAPRLPLPSCSMSSQCKCRFQKYPDRRDDDKGRRFDDASERAKWFSGDERRSTGRRRQGG